MTRLVIDVRESDVDKHGLTGGARAMHEFAFSRIPDGAALLGSPRWETSTPTGYHPDPVVGKVTLDYAEPEPDAARICRETDNIAKEITSGRIAAHAKHGGNSIEAVARDDIARWLPILGEEFGEVAQLLTYDKADPDTGKPSWGDLRGELVDLATVATAWIAAIDRGDVMPEPRGREE